MCVCLVCLCFGRVRQILLFGEETHTVTNISHAKSATQIDGFCYILWIYVYIYKTVNTNKIKILNSIGYILVVVFLPKSNFKYFFFKYWFKVFWLAIIGKVMNFHYTYCVGGQLQPSNKEKNFFFKEFPFYLRAAFICCFN